MTFLFYFFLILFLLLAFILAFVILIQESKSLGLGASFGGEVATSLFGTSTADVIKKFTGRLGYLFAILCIILSFWCSALGRAKSTPVQVETVSE